MSKKARHYTLSTHLSWRLLLLALSPLLLCHSGGRAPFAAAVCNLKYFMSFQDAACSLLTSFDDHEELNKADGTCTPLADGRAYRTTCDEKSVLVQVYQDATCSGLVDDATIALDTCSLFTDPLHSGESSYVMVRNEVISPTPPPEEGTDPTTNDNTGEQTN